VSPAAADEGGTDGSALRVDVFTIFPEIIESYCSASILGRARRAGLFDLRVHDLRQWATDPHRSVDDAPFGGGPGMVLAPEPVFTAVEMVDPPRPLHLLAPGGQVFNQQFAAELAGVGKGTVGKGTVNRNPATSQGLRTQSGVPGGADAAATARRSFSLLCGRYEGVDQRIADHLVDGEISVGDYVLAGGELGALVVIEAVVRLVPGAIGNEASTEDESFTTGLLEYPQYTRPAQFRGWQVPDVLTSGDHGRVAAWRLSRALERTAERRPDLLARRGPLGADEVQLLARYDYRVAPLAAVESAAPSEPPMGAGPTLPEEQASP
jgi:tRNA (guanine37-N1)-methyltransferase